MGTARNPHIGSSLDDFLAEEGILDECEEYALRDVRYSAEELKAMRERGEGRSDWDRVKKMTDEEIECAIAEDPDAEALPGDQREDVEIGMPKGK